MKESKKLMKRKRRWEGGGEEGGGEEEKVGRGRRGRERRGREGGKGEERKGEERKRRWEGGGEEGGGEEEKVGRGRRGRGRRGREGGKGEEPLTFSEKVKEGSYLPPMGLEAAMMEQRACSEVTMPALDMEMLCCSMASCMLVLSWSFIWQEGRVALIRTL